MFCGLALALALGAAQVARAEDAVTLAVTYKVGEEQHYKTTSKTQVLQKDLVFMGTDRYMVKEVKPNGDVVFLVTPEGRSFIFGGSSPQTLPYLPKPSTVTFDKYGKLLGIEKDESAAGSQGSAMRAFSPGMEQLITIANNIILPDKPVKPEDTWQTEIDDPAAKGKKITIKDTYLGTEKREGVTLWKIKQSVEAPVDETGSKMTSTVTALLEPATGHPIYADGEATNVPTMSFGLISWTSETALIKPDSAADKTEAAKKP